MSQQNLQNGVSGTNGVNGASGTTDVNGASGMNDANGVDDTQASILQQQDLNRRDPRSLPYTIPSAWFGLNDTVPSSWSGLDGPVGGAENRIGTS